MTLFQDLYKKATVRFRPLPHFLIIGAQKSGTTSLFHYITQHPEVFENKSKEIHYFDKHYPLGTDWYRSHFPLLGNFLSGRRLGEATPYYLCHPHAAERIHQLLPQVKLIVVLRNPTDRAISHYYHEVKKGRENLPILDALQEEEKRCAGEWQRMLEEPAYASQAHQSFSYKQRGVYLEQLQRYWDYFPKEKLLIVESGKLFSQPHLVLKEVFAFLEVETSAEIKDVAVKNANPLKKVIDEEVYTYLDSFFTSHNQALYRTLGKEFDW